MCQWSSRKTKGFSKCPRFHTGNLGPLTLALVRLLAALFTRSMPALDGAPMTRITVFKYCSKIYRSLLSTRAFASLQLANGAKPLSSKVLTKPLHPMRSTQRIGLNGAFTGFSDNAVSTATHLCGLGAISPKILGCQEKTSMRLSLEHCFFVLLL